MDTTSSATDRSGQNVQTTTIATSTLGDTIIAGVRAWKITTTSTGQLTGSGKSQDGDFTISGTVTDSGMVVISARGELMASAQANYTSMSRLVSTAMLSTPITRKETTRI